ncbi:MAG: hypothetical protein H6925_04600 [Holosporaceae bacterium]|nr:MAG: hypothetical protein H6925_04600 [Holosporaceae bacterium]
MASLWGPAPAQAAADEEPPHSSAPVQGPRTTSEDGVPENGDLQDETYALSLHMAEFCLSSPTTLTREAAPWDDQADAAASGSGQHTVGAVGSSHQGPLRDILTPGQQLYGGLPFNLANWIDPGHKGPPEGFSFLI